MPAATVTRLAQTFAKEARIGETIEIDGLKLRYRPSVLYTFRGLTAKEYGVQGWRTGLILNMLVGNIDAVGGLILGGAYARPQYFDISVCEYPPKRADLAQSVFYPYSNHHIAQTPCLTVQDPKAWGLAYTPEMQIFYGSNRPMSIPNSGQQFDGLAKTFNVVIDVIMTENCWFADIVLPDKTYLESWHFAPTRGTPDTGHSAIRQPMANPYNLEWDAFGILWEISKRLDMRDKFAEEMQQVLGPEGSHVQARPRLHAEGRRRDHLGRQDEEGLLGCASSRASSAARRTPRPSTSAAPKTSSRGPARPRSSSTRTSSSTPTTRSRRSPRRTTSRRSICPKYKIAYSPLPNKDHAFPTPHREATDFRSTSITHKRMYRNQSGFTVNNAILNQALGPDAATNYVQINAATAAQLGIKSGDTVTIETRVGKINGTAQVVQGIRPDTIAVSYHYGQWSPGLLSRGTQGHGDQPGAGVSP